MEFPCLRSRIFKPKVEKFFTLRDREKNQSFSKPTEQGSNYQVLESDPIVNYIAQILAKKAFPSTENESFRCFW